MHIYDGGVLMTKRDWRELEPWIKEQIDILIEDSLWYVL